MRKRAPDVFAGFIIEGVPHARIRPVAEFFVDTHATEARPSALVGFIVRCSEHFAVDAATRIGWQLGAPLFEARAGFTVAFTL